jgi:pimeloyl-ACP methyl ester carboxylesterase
VRLTFDHGADHASRRARKEKIRARVAGFRDAPHTKYGLRLDPDWQAKVGRADLAVFVHGFNACPAGMEFLALPARKAGLPCGMIAYPNDQALADSAGLVSAELKRLVAKHPNCRVNLVTHSMGGLIARECVEDAKLNPGNVNRLIMVAPPNGGSQLAHFGFATDTCELIAGLHWKRPLAGMLDCIDDGLGEAVHDLRPGSPYLQKMANYRRNPQVRYTILLGTKAPFTAEQVNKARQQVAGYCQRWRAVQLFGPKLDRLLGDADELIDGRGDGAVAVKRGRLEGVADTVLLKFQHLATHPEHPEVQSVQKAVLARLVADRRRQNTVR